MLCRDVIEGEQGIAILDQAVARLLVLRSILGNEAIEGLVGANSVFGVVDLMKIALWPFSEPTSADSSERWPSCAPNTFAAWWSAKSS